MDEKSWKPTIAPVSKHVSEYVNVKMCFNQDEEVFNFSYYDHAPFYNIPLDLMEHIGIDVWVRHMQRYPWFTDEMEVEVYESIGRSRDFQRYLQQHNQQDLHLTEQRTKLTTGTGEAK